VDALPAWDWLTARGVVSGALVHLRWSFPIQLRLQHKELIKLKYRLCTSTLNATKECIQLSESKTCQVHNGEGS